MADYLLQANLMIIQRGRTGHLMPYHAGKAGDQNNHSSLVKNAAYFSAETG
jgi:hypothetical protein